MTSLLPRPALAALLVVAGLSACTTDTTTPGVDAGSSADAGSNDTDAGTPELKVEILSPTAGASLTSNPIELRVRFTNKAELASAKATLNGTTTTLDASSLNAQGEGTWSVKGKPGANTIAVAVQDKAGHQIEKSVTVTLNLAGPSVSIVSPIEGTVLAANPVSVQVHIARPAPLASASYVLNGGTVTPITLTSLDAEGDVTLSLTAVEGANTLVVNAKDEDGLESSDSLGFKLDATGPAVTVLSPSVGTIVTTNPAAVSVRFASLIGLSSATLTVNGTTSAIDLIKLDAQNELTLDVACAEGTNQITVTAKDIASREVSDDVTFTVDSKGPSVEILSPSAGAVFTASPVATQIRLKSISGLASATVTVNGTSSPIDLTKLDANGEGTLQLPAIEGANTVSITAKDVQLRESTESTSFVLDALGPTVTLLSPTSGQIFITNGISLHTRLTGVVALQSATLTLNGVDSTVDLTQLDAQHELTLSLQGKEGTNTLKLLVTDSAGQTNSATVSFLLDTVGPSVHILSPSAGAVVGGGSFTVKAELTGLVDFTSASIEVNGTSTALDLTTLDQNHQLTVSAQAANESSTVKISLTDTQGRTVSETITLTVDTTPPALNLISPVINFAETRRLLRGTATDNTGLGTITYTLNGGTSVPVTVSGNPATLDVSELLAAAPGANTLVITVTDQVGNSTTKTVPFRFGLTTSSGGAQSGSVRNGNLYMWGRAGSGQTGLGPSYSTDATSPKTPQLLTFGAANTTVASLSVNQVFSSAIRSDGTIWAWGSNASGQVGIDSADAKIYSPVQVPGITTAVQAALGYDHALVLLSNGTVMAWGANDVGQLGVVGTAGNSDKQKLPVTVQGLPTNIVKVAAGSAHAAALTADGKLFLWGRNQYANLGQGTTEAATVRHPTPLQVPNMTDVVDVACGRDNVLALHANGTISSWGLGSSGALGTGVASGTVATIADVQTAAGVSLTNAVAVFANGFTGYALTKDGQLYGWGSNSSGSLALGATTPASQTYAAHVAIYSMGPPAQYFDSLYRFTSIGVGALQTIVDVVDATTSEKETYAWGWSFTGSLGVGEGSSSTWAQTTPLYVTFPAAPASTP